MGKPNINIEILNSYLTNSIIKQEPFFNKIPYPQADDINKVRQFIESASHGYTTKEEQIEINKFTGRQVDYYGNAAKYLGFITIIGQNYLATPSGVLLAQSDIKKKNRMIIERMMEIPSIRGVFMKIKQHPLTLNIVIESMRGAGVFLNPLTTEPRRAQTILSWVEWAIDKEFTH